jgi:hypothetical protein
MPGFVQAISSYGDWHSTNSLALAGDDHDRFGLVVASDIIFEPAAEVTVAHVRPHRPVQRATLLSVKEAGAFIA